MFVLLVLALMLLLVLVLVMPPLPQPLPQPLPLPLPLLLPPPPPPQLPKLGFGTRSQNNWSHLGPPWFTQPQTNDWWGHLELSWTILAPAGGRI